MAILRYHPEDLRPILVLGNEEVGVFNCRRHEECDGKAHFFNHGRFRLLVLEFGGLHVARALRVWNTLYLAADTMPPPSKLVFTPETTVGTAGPDEEEGSLGRSPEDEANEYADAQRCPGCGKMSYHCECGEEGYDTLGRSPEEAEENYRKWLEDDQEDDGEEDDEL